MTQEFQQPGNMENGDQSDAQEFSTPEAEELETTPEAEASVASEAVLSLFAAVESQLAREVSSATAGPQDIEQFGGMGNIQGVGVGTGEFELNTGASSALPGEPALNIYVAAPMSESEVKAVLAEAAGVSAANLNEVPVNVIVTGIIEARSFTGKIRPVPGGWSIAHCSVTAGTLGCLALGRSAPRNNRLLLLSNNHVIANSNNAQLGNAIISPGPYDGGHCPNDRIAILERFVPINFSGGANYVDCATGWCWPALVRKEHVYRSGSTLRYFNINRAIRAPQVGMTVGKTGRTTELTVGRVMDVNSTIRVHYGGGRYALFRDQVAVQAASGNFSQGGDSGSVIWTWDGNRNPVALLFAGGGGVTFANKMHHVVAALDINIYA